MQDDQEGVQQELFEDAALQTEPVAPEVPQEPEPPEPEPEAAIPSWRLREEAEGRRVAEDRARALEARLVAIDQHLRQRASQQRPTNFFENPDEATRAHVVNALGPFVQETRRQLMYMGRMVAASRHGDDKLEAAERAFLEARRDQVLDPADYERVIQAPNRYDAVVNWHKRQNVLSSVGDDPAAWFEKQLEARMADPNFQAQMMERVRTGAPMGGRPSVTKLPPSLSRSTAAARSASEPLGDLSDASLFAFATRK